MVKVDAAKLFREVAKVNDHLAGLMQSVNDRRPVTHETIKDLVTGIQMTLKVIEDFVPVDNDPR